MSQVESRFGSSRTLKPASTRGESVETFIIAKKKRHKIDETKLKASEKTNSGTNVTTNPKKPNQ